MRKLSLFRPENQLKGKKLKLVIWFCVRKVLTVSGTDIGWVSVLVLRVFGAEIGKNVVWRSGVKTHFPWNLTVGDNCWIGEEVWFINHEKVTIGSDVCISQRSIICSGGHDYRSISLEYAHKPVTISDGAWICMDAKILPGVNIGECSVVSAGEIARNSLPDYSMLVGGQVCSIDPPK